MISLSKHFTVRPSAVWIMTGVSFFVISWRLCVFATGYFGAQKVADTLTAITRFKQDLIPNHANTRLVFCQDTERGVGIYFCNTDGGKPRLLCEKIENRLRWQRFTMLGWSPDDSLFACAWPDNNQDKEFILIFDGTNGEQLAQIGADQDLYQFAWLNADSFACSTHTDVRVVVRQGKNGWEYKRHFEKVAANLEDLTAISEHSVAWREAGAIWLLDFAGGQPQKIWEATTDTLVGFAYDKSSGEFLLNCSHENGQFVIRFSPGSKGIADTERIGNQQHDFVSNVKWIDGGPRYAYVNWSNDRGHWPDLCIQTKPNLAPILVPWKGWIENFSLSGDHIFFTGSENGELPSIWEYDIKSKTIRCVVDSSTRESAWVKITAPLIGAVTNASGGAKTYYLWQPAQVSVGGKYPLIITKQFWNWCPYNQIAVNEGYYFAIVDESCVAALREVLAKNPNVDGKRVYLYESSTATAFASELISENPELWRGAILFSPTTLPDLSRLQNKKILVIAGNDDYGQFARLSRYQNQAAALGTSVTLFFSAGAGHIPNSVASERDRARQFARFLSANR